MVFRGFPMVFELGNVFPRLKTLLSISRHPGARLEVICERFPRRTMPYQLQIGDFPTISEPGSGSRIINTVKYCSLRINSQNIPIFLLRGGGFY